ncbi:SH3 domain-containing protein [Roseomonas chloroacetimidivorans]|jgi:hypothetical protein|uniref:SH3 domain-containing protein n=1 Tax=Roseomonas chloroacetimidivorans TaxID=1766656 RepID=UPI003C77F80C
MIRKEVFVAGLLAPVLLALGGCLEEAPPKGAPVADRGGMERVRTAAEARVRDIARDPEALRFRAVETYRQAMPDTYAVCGQATVVGSGVFIPFVSVVKATNGGMEVQQHVARTNIEATRVYVEMVSRCFDGGGPVTRADGIQVAQPAPPLPSGLPLLDQVVPEPPKTPDLVTAAARPADSQSFNGTLTMRQNGNIRSSPNGGGAVLRVARTGSVLSIYGTAPGGWYQVGENGPEGWVHGSLASVQPGMLTPVQSASAQ